MARRLFILSKSEPARSEARPYDLATAAHDYPARDAAPARTILICTHPRSGSTLLGEALYFAGGLGCPLEYFHAGFRPSFARRWDVPDLERLSAAVRRHRTEPNGTMAVKLFWRDVEDIGRESDPALADFTNIAPGETQADYYRALAGHVGHLFPNPAIVHLWREDRLRQAISAAVAVDTGRWRAIPGSGEAAASGEAQFDVERIERFMAYSDYCHGHFRNLFAAMGVTPHPLTYEALTTDYDASVRAVLAHLGSTSEPPVPRMQRQADAGSEALVLRYLREHASPAR